MNLAAFTHSAADETTMANRESGGPGAGSVRPGRGWHDWMTAGRRRQKALTAILTGLWLAAPGMGWGWGTAGAQPLVEVGAGSYTLEVPDGLNPPQREVWMGENAAGRPRPTNRWWSSLMWQPFSESHYPHPLAVKAEPTGLRVHDPGPSIHAVEVAIFGYMPQDRMEDVVIGLATGDDLEAHEFERADATPLGDWFVRADFSGGGAGLATTYGMGSPLVWAEADGGEVLLQFVSEPREVVDHDHGTALVVNGRRYGLYPLGEGQWQRAALDDGRGWSWRWRLAAADDERGRTTGIAVALLPDDRDETFELFARAAAMKVVGSRVWWSVDHAAGEVRTVFLTDAEPFGPDKDTAGVTLLALYPHQWLHLDSDDEDAMTGWEYPTVRGPMKVIEAAGFDLVMPLPGLLPVLPALPPGSEHAGGVARALAEAAGEQPDPRRDTYWLGKQLGRWATLAGMAAEAGEAEAEEVFVRRMRMAVEGFLDASDPQSGVFHYDADWGALIGHPSSFGSDAELNDHHFHYGYMIRAAAELARRDPEWAEPERFGGMVELLIRDVVSPFGDDPLFPFLRCFEPYAGHGWASGHARFADGNNQESSSEAMHCWAGIALWGAATGDHQLRDLGLWLHASELQAIECYWFDVEQRFHHPDYPSPVVTMVWGGKGANGTWFSGEPEMIHGINWLPFHPGSLYLGRHPEYVERNYGDLLRRRGSEEWQAWGDLVWMYRALADPADARRQVEAAGGWDRAGIETGNSRAQLRHWVATMERFGRINREVRCDHGFFAVWDHADGTRTHVAWNPDPDQVLRVTFSDGVVLECPPGGLGNSRGEAGD